MNILSSVVATIGDITIGSGKAAVFESGSVFFPTFRMTVSGTNIIFSSYGLIQLFDVIRLHAKPTHDFGKLVYVHAAFPSQVSMYISDFWFVRQLPDEPLMAARMRGIEERRIIQQSVDKDLQQNLDLWASTVRPPKGQVATDEA